MLALRERLQQLRSVPAAAAVPTLDAEWSERLARLRLLARERAGQGVRAPGASPPLPGVEHTPALRTLEVRVSALRTRLSGLDLPSTLAPPWDPDRQVALERLRFFDTETTGLCGGCGLKVYLLGVLRWQDDTWVLRQYLMTRPIGEAALVAAWQAECSPDAVLVSYNGKRFDVPALRTLEILHGRPATSPAAHWDLLYPVRRAFKGHWPDCRLTTAERMLAGIERHHDLPGSEAPKAWRQFLACGDTTQLIRVMQHNRSDLEALLRILRALLADARTAPRLRRPGARAGAAAVLKPARPDTGSS